MTNGCRHDLFPCIDHSITTIIILTQSFFVCVGGSSIHNLITHAYIPDDYVPQIINIDSTCQKLYEEYVLERIYRYMSLWDTVKKRKKSYVIIWQYKTTVKARTKNVYLKEMKQLFWRLMVLASFKRDIDQKQVVGSYEFILTP